MELREVVRLLDALDAENVAWWVLGGWGVDALVGHQTREHRDLDLAVDASAWAAATRACTDLGYVVETDWWPVRVELASPHGWVDLHPVSFDAAGDGVQSGLDGATYDYPRRDVTTGELEGRQVRCMSAAWQERVHSGYEPRAQDLHDLAVLGGLTAP
jgi:lincosamide nucleotidyltransferase A/C/D/E